MSIRLRALERARKYIGVKEDFPGNNHGQLINRWMYKATGVQGGIPWCAAFVWNMYLECGKRLGVHYPASVLSWAQWAYDNKYIVKRPFKGDVVCFDYDGPTPTPNDHIGFVDKVYSIGIRYLIRTIEGNTGDAVRVRTRWVKPYDLSQPRPNKEFTNVVFIRIPGA